MIYGLVNLLIHFVDIWFCGFRVLEEMYLPPHHLSRQQSKYCDLFMIID